MAVGSSMLATIRTAPPQVVMSMETTPPCPTDGRRPALAEGRPARPAEARPGLDRYGGQNRPLRPPGRPRGVSRPRVCRSSGRGSRLALARPRSGPGLDALERPHAPPGSAGNALPPALPPRRKPDPPEAAFAFALCLPCRVQPCPPEGPLAACRVAVSHCPVGMYSQAYTLA